MKIISALTIAAAIGLAIPATAMAQQTVGSNGAVLDGMGAGGNIQNHYVFDGPPNADAASISTSGLKVRHGARVNSADCAIVSDWTCPAWDNSTTFRVKQ